MPQSMRTDRLENQALLDGGVGREGAGGAYGSVLDAGQLTSAHHGGGLVDNVLVGDAMHCLKIHSLLGHMHVYGRNQSE